MATDFKGYLIEEFTEDYEQGELPRREAVKLIGGVVGSVALADSLLAACSPPIATVGTPLASIPADTAGEPPADITAGDVSVPGPGGELTAYSAMPAAEGSRDAVLVCHENRGLTEHIKDVTRRLANAGYAALAIDLLTREGGTAALNSSDVPGILGNTPPDQFVQDFASGWEWLKSQDSVISDGVGMVGFCFGGGVTWRVAIGLEDVRAAVPFYGPHPAPDELQSVQAAVLGIYAGSDERINRTIPDIEAAMQQYGKVYEKVIYEGTDHAFHNDTGPRYKPEAARDAWSRTLAWFARYLGTGN